MCFEKVYGKVEECKQYSVYELVNMEGIDIIRDDDLTQGRKAKMMSHEGNTIIFLQEGLSDQEEENLLLHELGHYYFDSGCSFVNKRMEENNANLFMCLFLIKNDIWQSQYFQEYLMSLGIDHKITNQVNDMIMQFKMTIIYENSWLIKEI